MASGPRKEAIVFSNPAEIGRTVRRDHRFVEEEFVSWKRKFSEDYSYLKLDAARDYYNVTYEKKVSNKGALNTVFLP